MALADLVRQFMDALRDMAREQSDANAERVADALDGILLRPEPEAAPVPQLEPDAAPVPQLEPEPAAVALEDAEPVA